MRHPSFVLPVMWSLLACGLACAQGAGGQAAGGQAVGGQPDTAGLNQRFENLRAIERFGASFDTVSMRNTLFTPMPYDLLAYSKIPKKARADFEKGNSALQHKEYAKAEQLYESAIAEHPEFALAHHNLGVAAMNLDDWKRARGAFQAAVKNDPQMAAAYQNLGVLAIKQNDLTAGLEPLQNANRLDPSDLKTLTLLAYCKALTQQQENAVLTAKRVHSFKQHTGYAYSHMIAATALQSLGRHDEAIQEYKQFVAEDPSDPRTATAKEQIKSLEAASH